MVITATRRHLGIAMPAEEGFEFVATNPDCDLLEGSSFRRLEQLSKRRRAWRALSKNRTAARCLLSRTAARLSLPAIVLRRRTLAAA
jgi:hypothetical protein